MQILSIWHEVDKILRGVWASFCQVIYKLIAFLFDLFMNVANIKILSQAKIVEVYNRVTLILAIVMTFYVMFEVVKYVVSPDTISDKEKGPGNLVKRMIIVVVLIGTVPFIFEKAYDLQDAIFKQQILSKVILGKEGIDPSTYGKSFSANIFGMFYKIDKDIWGDTPGKCEEVDCATIVKLNLQMLANTGEMPFLNTGISAEDQTILPGDTQARTVYKINFDGFLAILVGGVIVWMLLMYVIDAGTRVAQLTFLQIIAPIPIISYLSPKKDGMFEKWYKQCLSVYLGLFIRLAIIYFVLLLCDMLADAFESKELFENLSDQSPTMKTFVYIALVIGLLAFAKRVPKMLEELFPKMSSATGTLGFTPKDRGFAAAGRIAGFGAGAVLGGAAGIATGIAQGGKRMLNAKAQGLNRGRQIAAMLGGAAMGAAKGSVGGITRGAIGGAQKGNLFKNAVKGAGTQIARNKQFGARQASGYGLKDQIGDSVRSTFGWASREEAREAKKAPIERQSESYRKIQKANDDMRARAEKKINEDGKGGEAGDRYRAAQKVVRDLQEDPETRKRYAKYQSEDAAKLALEDARHAAVVRAKDEKEATALAVQKKKAADAIKREDYTDQQAYIEARKKAAEETTLTDDQRAAARKLTEEEYAAAEATVDEKEYSTSVINEEEYARDLQKAKEEAKKAKDEAIAAYIDSGEDATIETKKSEIVAEIDEYNKYASKERQIDERFVETVTTEDGKKKKVFQMGAKDFDDFASKDVAQAISENTQTVIGINAEQEHIKRQTAGSKAGEKK